MTRAAQPAPAGEAGPSTATPEVALITGAARGIGAASARALARDGVRVCVADVDEVQAAETAAALGGLAVAMDVADAASCAAAAEHAARELGPLTMLINNAGLTRSGFIHKMSDGDWDLVHDVILRGTFNAMRAVAPWFRDRERRARRIVNISSIAGIHGGAAGANYVAAKAGVIGLTKAMAAEWAPFNVTVNAIAPGMIETRLLDSSLPDGMRAAVARRIPLGRLGTPQDVAAAVRFLCSSGAGYITGQVLEVHGGLTELTPAGGPVSS
ncbi:MAG TPA: SDR family oxidoreductase [Solirubrobacteraceae bacterium]|nr:SDR family oxidoreductase [Solirubrobacteraceae bacterium]